MQVCVFNLVDHCQEYLREHNEQPPEEEEEGSEVSGTSQVGVLWGEVWHLTGWCALGEVWHLTGRCALG